VQSAAVKTTRVHLRGTIRRLAPIVAAAAATLACLTALPALAQSHEHHGGGGGGPRGGGGGPGWNRGGGMGGGPRGGPGPGFGREAPMGGPPGAPRGVAGPSWDQRRYNGYWVGGRWYFGAPQGPAFDTPGFRPGFTPWRRGSFLPPAYQNFGVYDFERYHLRRPPYGYHWVQVGGEFLLVSVSTGLVFDVVTGG
jgi:Ni/Co efflux regulator RcnB